MWRTHYKLFSNSAKFLDILDVGRQKNSSFYVKYCMLDYTFGSSVNSPLSKKLQQLLTFKNSTKDS